MSGILLAAVGGLGLLAGGLNTMLIDRIPDDERLTWASRCPRCREPIRAADTIPVVSWVRLRRTCRTCDEPISARYPAVEVLTSALVVITAAVIGLTWELPAFLFLAVVGVSLAVIDLDTMRLPNALTFPCYPIMAGLLLLAAVGTGQWNDFVRALLGGLAMLTFYLVLHLISPGGMGLGDVKFSGVIGMALGWLGWGPWIVGAVGAFFVAAIVGIGLMVRRGRGVEIPFGPYMVAAAMGAICFGPAITAWYTGSPVA